MEVGTGQDRRTEDGAEDGDKDVKKVAHCIQATRLGKAETCGESVRHKWKKRQVNHLGSVGGWT